MSRGFLIELRLEREVDGKGFYSIRAEGCFPPNSDLSDRVGNVEIDKALGKCKFLPRNGWEGEEFYIPNSVELKNMDDSEIFSLPVNKSFGWWNYRLIQIIKQIFQDPGYKKQAQYYQ